MLFLAHPLFLIGLAAVAVPVVVHLFDLRRYRKVYFSNVDRLEALQQASRHESQLRRRLLLASRIAVVVFLVLAFANPSIDRGGDTLQPGTTAVSVYIDNSFSMLQQATDGDLLECAKRKAAEVASAYSPGDRFQLLTNRMAGEEFHWLDRDDFLAAVDELTVSPNSVMLSEAVRRQQGFLHDAQVANRRAYVVSDFQRTTSDVACLPDSAFSDAPCTFIPLRAATVDNVYLDTLVFDAPSFRVGDRVVVEVRLRNASGRMLEQVPLYLYADGRRRAQSAVTLAPHGETVVPLHFVVDHGGAVEGCVVTSDSPVTFDDTLFFAFNVARRISVLEIYGNSPNPWLHRLFASDTTLLFRAVSAADGAALLSSAAAGSGYDCVILDEVEQLSSRLVQTLHDYAGRGGSLVVVPPSNADRQQYDALLQPLHAPLLDGWSTGAVQVSGIDFDNMLYRSVFESRPDNSETPRFNGRHRLKNVGSTVSQPLLTLPAGEAVLSVFYPSSQRPCYLFAAPLREEYTDLVAQPLFVPTLYNMALYSCPPQQPYHLVSDDGPPVDLPFSVTSPATLSGIYGAADGARQGSFTGMPRITATGGRSRLSASNLVSSAGCYRLSTPSSETLSLAFNYQRRESVMEFLSDDELPDYAGRTLTLAAERPVALHTGHARSLSHLCLWTALVMLLAEVLLARGRRNRPAKE